MECQLWSMLARLVNHESFLLSRNPITTPVYLSQKKKCNFFKMRHNDGRCFECQERNYMESSWYLRLYVYFFFSNVMHSVLFLLVLIQSDTATKYLNREGTKGEATWIQSFKSIANTNVTVLPVICIWINLHLVFVFRFFWGGRDGENFSVLEVKMAQDV